MAHTSLTGDSIFSDIADKPEPISKDWTFLPHVQIRRTESSSETIIIHRDRQLGPQQATALPRNPKSIVLGRLRAMVRRSLSSFYSPTPRAGNQFL
jgi:hypothetical protein